MQFIPGHHEKTAGVAIARPEREMRLAVLTTPFARKRHTIRMSIFPAVSRRDDPSASPDRFWRRGGVCHAFTEGLFFVSPIQGDGEIPHERGVDFAQPAAHGAVESGMDVSRLVLQM